MDLHRASAPSSATRRRPQRIHVAARLGSLVWLILCACVVTSCSRATRDSIAATPSAVAAAAVPRSARPTRTAAHLASATATQTPTASPTARPSSTPEPAQLPVERLSLVTQVGGATRAMAALGQRVILGLGMRVGVADVSDPDAPRIVGRSVPLRGIVNALAVDGGRMWAATSDGTLYSLELVDDRQPTILGEVRLPDTSLAVVARDGWVFVAASEAGLVAVDGRDAAKPVIVDVLASDEPALRYDAHQELVLVRNTVWLADSLARGGRGVLYAIDVSAPEQLARIGRPMDRVNHLAAAGPDRLLLDRGDIELVDVRDPERSVVVGTQWFRQLRIAAMNVKDQRAVVVTATEPRMLMSFNLNTMSPDDDSAVVDHSTGTSRYPGDGPIVVAGHVGSRGQTHTQVVSTPWWHVARPWNGADPWSTLAMPAPSRPADSGPTWSTAVA